MRGRCALLKHDLQVVCFFRRKNISDGELQPKTIFKSMKEEDELTYSVSFFLVGSKKIKKPPYQDRQVLGLLQTIQSLSLYIYKQSCSLSLAKYKQTSFLFSSRTTGCLIMKQLKYEPRAQSKMHRFELRQVSKVQLGGDILIFNG